MTVLAFFCIFWVIAVSLFVFVGLAILMRLWFEEYAGVKIRGVDFAIAVTFAIAACVALSMILL